MLKSTTLLLKKHILPNLAGKADHDAVRIIYDGQMLFKLSPITNRRFSRVRSGRFLKTQMMRAAAFNYAALNKDFQIIHYVHGSLLNILKLLI